MYERFENDKTKNLDFTDIYKLVEPIKKLKKGEWLPDIYFIGSTLKEYAGLPADYEIKAFIEHAPILSDFIEGAYAVHESYPSIVCSSFRASVIKRVTNNNGAFAVGPYIAYAKSALSDEKLKTEKERLGKNLLVFPAHSIRGLKASYDVDWFGGKIKDISDDFDSVRVCLFWKDVLLGMAEKYQNYGFEVVTAGHYYDPMFIPRLKSIIETSHMTMSNKLGTYIGYSVYLKKPHYMLNTQITMDLNSSDDGEKFAKGHLKVSNKMNKMNKNEEIDHLIELISEYNEKITEDQYNILNKYWGYDDVKTPKELQQLLLLIEGEYQLKFDCVNKLHEEISAKNDEIRRKITEINSLHNSIRNKEAEKNQIIDLKLQYEEKVRTVIISKDKNIKTLKSQLESFKNQSESFQNQIESFKAVIELKDAKLIKSLNENLQCENKLNETILSKDNDIKNLQRHYDRYIKIKKQQIIEKDIEIKKITDSKSWKITKPLRKLGSWRK